MELRNYTPFPNLRFYGEFPNGDQFGVVLVKGTFGIRATGHLIVADEQAAILQDDRNCGPVNASSVYIPSDIVPNKPSTDVIVSAVAKAPGGKALQSWKCGISIPGELAIRKELRVTGPRRWEPVWLDRGRERIGVPSNRKYAQFKQWRLTEPEPTLSVPVRYEKAFGGVLTKPQGTDDDGTQLPPQIEAYENNPVGCGWIDEKYTPSTEPLAAPQVESVLDPIHDPYKKYQAEGFGAIPPAWLPRRPKGGTYDQNWLDTVWPNWPDDYDFGFHNSAHPDLILKGYLKGDETIQLWGFDGSTAIRQVTLPNLALVAEQILLDGTVRAVRMNLDTLMIDISDDDPDEHRVFLSWRINYDADAVIAIALLGEPVGSSSAQSPQIPAHAKETV